MDTRDLSDTCLEDKDRKRQRQRHWERFNDIVTIVTQLTITDKLKNSYHDVEGYRLTVRVTWTAFATQCFGGHVRMITMFHGRNGQMITVLQREGGGANSDYVTYIRPLIVIYAITTLL